MADTHWKLRSDLEIHSEPNSGIILKDPISNGFYRFTPIQASVLELLNGELDLESVAQRVSQRHQTEVREEQIRDFVGKLQKLALLDHPYSWSQLEKARKRKRTVIQNLFSIKIHAFNPDRLLADLERRFRFCFTSGFAVLALTVALVAAVIGILNWESLFLSIGSIINAYSIPLIVIVVFAITTIHEFAHGVALKHFGGKVNEMGLMILYLIPAFYCNVTDAWMLGKRQRIWVSLAGSYIQIFLFALAIIAWRLLAPEMLLSRVCLVTVAFTLIQTLFNFNPLIRMDGYYVFSDLMELPNLRSKALTYIKNRAKSLITGNTFGDTQRLSLKEKRVFLYYGTASFLFTAALIGIMFERLGGWMIREYRSWGILLVSMLFLAVVPVTRKENAEESAKMLRLVVKRTGGTPWILIVLMLVLGVGFLPWELKVSGDVTIVASNKVSVTPQVMGSLKKIYVDQGSRVQAGQVLAEMENLEIANNYEETKGELASQKASLDLLLAGSRPEEIEKAKRVVETKKAELNSLSRVNEERAVLLEIVAKKEAELENARVTHERSQKLLETGLIARNDADRDRTAYEVQRKELSEAKGKLRVLEEQVDRNREIKRKELEQANSELKILLAGSRKETIRAVESQVRKLEEKLGIFEREIELLKIRSPIEGVVSTPYLRNRIGDYLNKGDVFCEIVSEGTMIVEMPVPEKEIGDVQLGFPITMKIRGYPKRWYQARVSNIAPVAASNGLVRTVLIQGKLDNRDGSLKAGMTGVGKILCGKRMIYDIVSRRLIRWLRTEFWEYLP
jgi:multidrug resistance efflux pump